LEEAAEVDLAEALAVDHPEAVEALAEVLAEADSLVEVLAEAGNFSFQSQFSVFCFRFCLVSSFV
jgi:hypothetical protein